MVPPTLLPEDSQAKRHIPLLITTFQYFQLLVLSLCVPMDTQEQTQIFTPIVQKVKMEAVEAYSFDDEGQFTVSQILLTGKNPLHVPLNIVSDNPSRIESSKRGREIVDFETQSRVMERAKEVQASFAPEFPSFWRLMTRSHVAQGFNWLGLPSELCKLHLPSLDAEVVLEDESGEKYNTKYLADRTGLCGGWRGFSSAQKLLEGDAVVFNLFRGINPIKFKVYIVRAKDFEVADAPSLPNFDACAKETGAHAQKNNGTCTNKEKNHPRLEIDYEPHCDWNIMQPQMMAATTDALLHPVLTLRLLIVLLLLLSVSSSAAAGVNPQPTAPLSAPNDGLARNGKPNGSLADVIAIYMFGVLCVLASLVFLAAVVHLAWNSAKKQQYQKSPGFLAAVVIAVSAILVFVVSLYCLNNYKA